MLCLVPLHLGAIQPVARLTPDVVESLVRGRCVARAARDFATADALKVELEGGGVKLQDEISGGTSWRYALLDRGSSPMIALSKRALDLHEDASELKIICASALALLEAGEPLFGRAAADAAFDFALAGCEDARLIDALATAQSLEFGRWKRPQPLASLQVCERLAAAGVADSSPAFDRAVAALARGGGEHAAAIGSIGQLNFDHPRPLRWLWRRAATLRKTEPPADDAGAAALRAAFDGFADPQLPLVIDLGCGFGTSLLSLARPGRPSGIPVSALLPERYNVLGCDASSLKRSFATGTATRWGVSGRAQFARASAGLTLARASASVSSRLAGVIAQFPTPFRVDGGGNSQLPSLV